MRIIPRSTETTRIAFSISVSITRKSLAANSSIALYRRLDVFDSTLDTGDRAPQFLYECVPLPILQRLVLKYAVGVLLLPCRSCPELSRSCLVRRTHCVAKNHVITSLREPPALRSVLTVTSEHRERLKSILGRHHNAADSLRLDVRFQSIQRSLVHSYESAARVIQIGDKSCCNRNGYRTQRQRQPEAALQCQGSGEHGDQGYEDNQHPHCRRDSVLQCGPWRP